MANKPRKREREIEKEWVLGRERDESNPTTDTWINIGQLPGHIIDLVDLQYAILLLFSLSLSFALHISLSLLSFCLCSTISGLNKLDLMLLGFFPYRFGRTI